MHAMRFLVLLLTQITSFSLALVTTDTSTDIHFILDFMSAQTSPEIVLENLCWKKDHKLELQKQLNKHNFRYRSFSSDKTLFDNFNQPYLYTVLVHMECDFKYFLEKARQTTLMNYPNVWIVFGEYSNVRKQNYYIPVNSLFVYSIKDQSKKYMEIKTIYRINKNISQYVEKLLGKWSQEKHIYEFERINFFISRTNFMKMPLRVTYIVTDNDTFNHLMDYRDRHIDNYTKINYALYNFICDLLNVTQIRLISNDWGFEPKNANTTFAKGMFEDLVYDKTDVAGTVSFTPSSRLKYFKYLFAPIKDFSVQFVFRAPPLAYYTNIFVLPFDNMVWITIGILLMFASFIINIIFNWEITEEAFFQQDIRENPPNFLDAIMMQIAIMCQMDFFHEPRSTSAKIATFFVLISFTFFYTAYSARIVLLIQSNTDQIKDLYTLYPANFEFGVEDQLYNRYYFKGPTDRANEYWRKLIYENKIRRPTGDRFLTAAEGIKFVRDSNFAFHTEQTVANLLINKMFSNNQKCSLKFIETIYNAGMPHLPVPRNSPYIQFFAISFRKLAETGLHNREYRRWFTKKPSCEGRTNIFVSVGLTESYFLFLIFGSGFCLSMILLFLENMSYIYFKFDCVM